MKRFTKIVYRLVVPLNTWVPVVFFVGLLFVESYSLRTLFPAVLFFPFLHSLCLSFVGLFSLSVDQLAKDQAEKSVTAKVLVLSAFLLTQLFLLLSVFGVIIDPDFFAFRTIFENYDWALFAFPSLVINRIYSNQLIDLVHNWQHPIRGRDIPSKKSDQLHSKEDGSVSSLSAVSSERRWLAMDLYSRSRRSRISSAIVLVAIGCLILGGLYSVSVAGDLVSNDAQKERRLDQMYALIDTYQLELTVLENDIVENQKILVQNAWRAVELRLQLHVQYGVDVPPLLAVIEHNLSVTPDLPTADPLVGNSGPNSTEIQMINSVVSRHEEALIVRDQLLRRRISVIESVRILETTLTSNINEYLVSQKAEPVELSLLMASGLTRFGLLLVVIFLVQILVGVYRYSARLSAFYASRADALIAGNDRVRDLGAWPDTFTPHDVDFGKQPKTPAQHVKDIVEAYMISRKKDEE
ncbi:hypothetical protein SLH49_11220 [Cognatiyoonia sp. IB215446]|uniref:hypothetical protein n=1 Tax=Cognatiyoonia sp. IB215446 TaxID=3097355 RepID=UPI002A17D29A|nr:hypothetical protein [Cognatiyoonia sp. IB215446]MDX8348558.1 hypothetical protein [Cognatiyoonia sp. IB215446]